MAAMAVFAAAGGSRAVVSWAVRLSVRISGKKFKIHKEYLQSCFYFKGEKREGEHHRDARGPFKRRVGGPEYKKDHYLESFPGWRRPCCSACPLSAFAWAQLLEPPISI